MMNKFIEMNFSKLMDNNEFFRNDMFTPLCKLSSQIIECKILASYVRVAPYVTTKLVPKCHCITWLNMHNQP